jgi:anaerobic selenocysteine-containing dehydrogenase
MCSDTPKQEPRSRCTLCPAGCELRIGGPGAGGYQSEPPMVGGAGLCPRGLAIGELLDAPGRIRWATRRLDGRRQEIGLAEAARAIIAAAGDRDLVFFIDGALPCEQLLAADAWCRAWPRAKLCVVLEPAERELLLGTEASGAAYLSDADLAGCDGFLIVGDAFAANPACSRGVFDRRAADARVAIIVIDPGGGSAAKFATCRVAAPPGAELAAIAELARAAGVDCPPIAPPDGMDVRSARSAGLALAGCKRLAIILAAEYGRGGDWRQIGYLAGRLAGALGGGVACQTTGANALAAVRLGPRLAAISLADALARQGAAWVTVGSDLLGMLGIRGREILAAGAAFASRSTEAAEFVMPAALAMEVGGTHILGGERQVCLDAVLPPPAGVLEPADVIGSIARAGGVEAPGPTTAVGTLSRLAAAAPSIPAGCAAAAAAASPVLMLGRQAADAGCGELTAHASWQSAVGSPPSVRLAAADARRIGVKDLDMVEVRTGELSVRARVRIDHALDAGAVVLPEALCEARAMCPLQVSPATEAVVASPGTVNIEAANDYASQTA